MHIISYLEIVIDLRNDNMPFLFKRKFVLGWLGVEMIEYTYIKLLPPLKVNSGIFN